MRHAYERDFGIDCEKSGCKMFPTNILWNEFWSISLLDCSIFSIVDSLNLVFEPKQPRRRSVSQRDVQQIFNE